jgi:hypothetical protein
LTTVAKVFLVLLVIGAIALSTASITLTAQAKNWRALAEGYRSDASAAWAYATSATAEARVREEQIHNAWQTATEQLAAAQKDLDARQQELAQQRAEIERLKVESASDKAAILKLSTALKTEQDRANQWQEQNQQALARALDLEKRNIDLNGRVQELAASVNVLENQSRVLQQRNYSLQEQVTQLRQQMAMGPQTATVAGVQPAAGAAQPLSIPAATPIRGKVLQMDGNVVGLSVGSSDGVKPNMAFVVFRGDKSLGRVVIRDVDPQVSAGTLDKKFGEPIQIGDQVIDEAGLMAQRP